MARIRSIYPEAWRSRKLALLSDAAERCWWRLQPACDDHGRAEDEPDVFASELYKVMRHVTPEDVDGWLWEMAEAGLIERYEVYGTHYLEVVRWSDFQHPQRAKKSAIPPAQSVSTRRVRDGSATPQCPIPDGGERSGEETDNGEEGESEGEPEQTSRSLRSVDNPVSPIALGLQARAAQIGGVA